MTFIIGAILVSLSGYCLVHFLKFSRGHFILDMALGWFAGGGYFCVSYAALVFGVGASVKAIYSVVIILFPILIMLAKRKSYLPIIAASLQKTKSMKYMQGTSLLSLESALLSYTVFAFILVFLHGASTPIISDDALSLRAYTPLLVYENELEGRAGALIITNGIWPSFLTVFFWHLKGGIERFYINYTVLTSLFCFLIVAYIAPIIKGRSRQGIYNVFLIMSLPLFVYQSTTTYADARMAMPYALGFLFFTFYVDGFDTKDLKSLVLFFLITCFIKEKGFLMGMTGMAVTLAAVFYAAAVYKRYSARVVMLITFTLTMLAAFFLNNNSILPRLWEMFNDTNISFQGSIINGLLVPLLNGLMHGETSNFSRYPLCIKFFGFLRSMFSSGNFGILFYLLFAAFFFNFRRIFTARMFWGFLFWSILFFGIFFYTVIIYGNLDNHEDVIHRSLIVLAVTSSIYLASIWGRPASGKVANSTSIRESGYK